MDEKKLLEEIFLLKAKLKEKEDDLARLRKDKEVLQSIGLNNREIARYSRQMLLPAIGVEGQVKLKHSSVLIVGAGGLGCPSSLYLAGAGIGRIGIIDYDNVEINNLHRQLLFTNSNIGESKAKAAEIRLKQLNDSVEVASYEMQITSKNALEVIKCYDVVIDATDNVATRYLLNDACVILKKPLISGAAVQFEGHLTIYNYEGPCYRCIFPKPPPPETVNNCGDSGVLGAVVGIIGVMQALQAIKIILNLPGVLSSKMLIFDGYDFTFRIIRLRQNDPNCKICSPNASVKDLIDYEQFCQSKANDKNPNLKILEPSERITVQEYEKFKNSSGNSHLLIDVRSNEEFQICHLAESISIPISKINKGDYTDKLGKYLRNESNSITNLFVVCRRGNDSQKAVQILKKQFLQGKIVVKDIVGGLHAWTKEVDPSFPLY